jgi:hypothetical protein
MTLEPLRDLLTLDTWLHPGRQGARYFADKFVQLWHRLAAHRPATEQTRMTPKHRSIAR